MPKLSRKTNKAAAVSVEDLVVAYDSAPVLEGITFDIAPGEVIAIIGPNGSGKTTLIKTILGIIRAKSGTVKIFGKPLHANRDRVGYVPQRFHFDRTFPITVKEFLALGMTGSRSEKRIREATHEVGLDSDILGKSLGSLSGGQLQRILVAQAVINKPDLLVLDEPSTGIDVVGEATFYEIVEHLNRTHGTTIVLISHDVAMVSAKVDRVICVNRRMLCSGPPSKTLTKATLEKVFGKSGVFQHEHHHHTDHHIRKEHTSEEHL